jgi:hypothetical protein
MRGILAEFLVAEATNSSGGVRTEWDAFDVLTESGVRVEVKSGAYLQSWKQSRPSRISFNVAPTLGWDATTNEFSTVRRRHADVYVFCVLAHDDPATLNPLDVDQWEFYCLSTAQLDSELGEQKTVSLGRLRSLGPVRPTYSTLGKVIEQLGRTSR